MQERNDAEYTKDGRKRNVFQKISFKIAQVLNTILKKVFGNPIPWVIITAIVFGRFYDLGYFGIRGSTVMLSGVCDDFNGNPRANLVQDQVVVSSVSDSHIEGILRKTREFVKCEHSRVSVDRIGTIKDLFSWNSTIAIPEIEKHIVEKKEVANDFKKYINKDLIVSGTCLDPKTNKQLDPFIKKVVSITNIKESKEISGVAYFYGVRDDKVSVVCDSQDITYEIKGITSVDDDSHKIEAVDPLSESLTGKKIFLTALCFPDYRVYRALGTEPVLKNYNLQKTPVEVIEEERDAMGRVKVLVASVLAKTVKVQDKEIPVLGHKIRCEQDTFPMVIVPSSDPNIKIEEQNSTLVGQ